MSKLAALQMKNIIIRGDFNCLMNLLIDRFPTGSLSTSQKTKHIAGLCKE